MVSAGLDPSVIAYEEEGVKERILYNIDDIAQKILTYDSRLGNDESALIVFLLKANFTY